MSGAPGANLLILVDAARAAGAIDAAMQGVLDVAAAVRREQARLLVSARQGDAWDIRAHPGVVVPDLTRGVWPYVCGSRSSLSDPLFRVCTRRVFHTGRHAAGDGERIVAVWGAL